MPELIPAPNIGSIIKKRTKIQVGEWGSPKHIKKLFTNSYDQNFGEIEPRWQIYFEVLDWIYFC